MKNKLPIYIDTDRLRKTIRLTGIRLGKIADTLGMKYSTLAGRLDGKTPFTTSEIIVLCRLLNLTRKDRDEIFFGD